jgi:hypothetical protein
MEHIKISLVQLDNLQKWLEDHIENWMCGGDEELNNLINKILIKYKVHSLSSLTEDNYEEILDCLQDEQYEINSKHKEGY